MTTEGLPLHLPPLTAMRELLMRGGIGGETAGHVEHELMVSEVGADATKRRGGWRERLDVGLVSLFTPNQSFST